MDGNEKIVFNLWMVEQTDAKSAETKGWLLFTEKNPGVSISMQFKLMLFKGQRSINRNVYEGIICSSYQ